MTDSTPAALGHRFPALRRHDQTRTLVSLVRGGAALILGSGHPGTMPVAVTFDELGLDGPAMARLRQHVKAQTGVELSETELPADSTIESAAARLWCRLAAVPFDRPRVDRAAEPGEWQTALLDLDGYLRRIGLQHTRDATLGVLREAHYAHSVAIGFDNVDGLLDRPVSLELDDIQHKVLRTGRGATCAEHNLLLAAALERLGFAVTRLAGRPRIGQLAVLPLTHMALLVEVDGVPWLVDAGLGGEAITEPVPVVGAQPAGRLPWRWRVSTLGDDEYVLQADRGDRWVDLYSFDLHPQRFVDYVVSHYYSTSYPGIPIANLLVAHRVTASERHVITGNRYTRTTVDGERASRPLDFDGLAEVLATVFDIALTEPELRTIWQRQAIVP